MDVISALRDDHGEGGEGRTVSRAHLTPQSCAPEKVKMTLCVFYDHNKKIKQKEMEEL